MEYKQAQSLIVRLVRHLKLLSLTVASLLICNAVLGLVLWHQSNRRDIILIPSNLHQKIHLTQNGFSSTYLEAMAMMLINDRLNLTPQTVQGSNQNLLQFVDPAFYAAFKKQLYLDEKSIRKGKISSSFYVNKVHSDSKALAVTIQGQLKRWVGERLIGAEPKSYQLVFSRNGTLLRLKSFQEIKNSAGG